MKFRRNTHTREGKFRTELFDREFKDNLWQRHGDIVHHLDSKRAMSFDELLLEIRKDTTNYQYSDMPSETQVGLALVRLIEENLVEVVDG